MTLPHFSSFTFTLNFIYRVGKLRLCRFRRFNFFQKPLVSLLSSFAVIACDSNYEFVLPGQPEGELESNTRFSHGNCYLTMTWTTSASPQEKSRLYSSYSAFIYKFQPGAFLTLCVVVPKTFLPHSIIFAFNIL